MNLLSFLQERFRVALTDLVADPAPYVSLIKAAADAKFGDYQANCAMSLAKVLGRKPREVAEEIVRRLPLDDALETPEIAGPGFINLRFKASWLAGQLTRLGSDDRLGVEAANPPKTIVIDFSSPNVAKPMHVGHLRSTIIGDSLTRILRFLGHRVITDNHLGDWGTQFGMLLYGYKHFRDEAALKADPVREMVRLYVKVRNLTKAADEDDEEQGAKKYSAEEKAEAKVYLDAARQETAKLQAGDPENLALWRQFQPWCIGAMEPIYERLGVKFDHTLGESFYNPMLAEVIASLLAKGLVQESKGALVAFLFPKPPQKDKEGNPRPPDPDAMVRKSDGAATYMTTDLATVRYRAENWKPDDILYVVDSRQGPHFKALYELARRWGYDRAGLHHLSFGSVLDKETGKPIKTREGGATELGELLDHSVREATRKYHENRAKRLEMGEDVPPLPPDELAVVLERVGIGAVKYADLSGNRESDYTFDWDKMLAMEGNTATYMQYAYARNRSIFRKGNEDPARFRSSSPPVSLEQPHERALGLQLLRFPEAVQAAAADYRPHLIAAYLWDLAKAYSGFFQNCPVLKAETPALRDSRLLLCDLTARIIQKGLDLLGIRTNERM